MAKIWEEHEVTLENLRSHLVDSGLTSKIVTGSHLALHTPSGIGYQIAVIEYPKFIRIGTYLPLDKLRSMEDKLSFEHRMNDEVFMPTSTLDDDGDLNVSYVMPYEHGLIAGQFTYIVNRFASMLQFMVDTFNTDGIIDFGWHADADVIDHTDEESVEAIMPPTGTLLN